jgi:hypothetical protein
VALRQARPGKCSWEGATNALELNTHKTKKKKKNRQDLYREGVLRLRQTLPLPALTESQRRRDGDRQ